MYKIKKTAFDSFYDATTNTFLVSALISGVVAIIVVMDYIIHGNYGTFSQALVLGIISLASDIFLLTVLLALTFWKLISE